MKTKSMRLLFIGNSHTYVNDMPHNVQIMARADGIACDTVMLAHGGWFLAQHVAEPEARFNILYGKYDYVILQEHSHPFAPEEKYLNALAKLNEWIEAAGSKAVLYATWAKKDEPEKQAEMNRIHRAAAEAFGTLLAPVGENWRAYQQSRPEIELYAEDGAHASPAGSEFAAKILWNAIRDASRV